MQLTAVYEQVPPEDGGGYIAWVQEISGTNTQGATLEETRNNLQEAWQGVLEIKRELLAEKTKAGSVIVEPFELHSADVA